LFSGRAIELGRAVLALVAFYATFAGLALTLHYAQTSMSEPAGWWNDAGRGLFAASVPALVAVVAVYFGLRRFGGWGADRLRIPTGTKLARHLGVGLLWGGGLAGAVLGMTMVGGARVVIGAAQHETYLSVALPVAAGLFLAAVLEELLFRGFPLARLARVAGPAAASVTLALVFAFAHRANPVVSTLGLVNIGLASLLISAVFFSAGGLPAAVGVHFGWNAGLSLVADAPVSGLRFRLPGVEYLAGPRPWWTGGGFGPEGGGAAAVVLLAALGWWWRRGFDERAVAR
jgi:hypothetical protein